MDPSTDLRRTGITPGLFTFAILYGGMTTLGGVLGNKQVAMGPLAVEAGIFSFLLLVVLSSATAELYGRKIANRMVITGFVPLIIAMILIWITLGLPAAHDMDPARHDAFKLILEQSPRLMGAGIIAYGVSTLLNVKLFDMLRQGGTGRWVAVLGAIASALSQIVDTLLFITISFYGVFPIGKLILGQMLAKVTLSFVLVPFAISAAVALGRWLDSREGGTAA